MSRGHTNLITRKSFRAACLEVVNVLNVKVVVSLVLHKCAVCEGVPGFWSSATHVRELLEVNHRLNCRGERHGYRLNRAAIAANL
jgi:hypothetical protein